MTSDCERFEVEVGMRQHGALDAARLAALEAHLAGCPACRKFAEDAARQEDSLRSGVARDAATVDWTRIHEGVRTLRRGQRRRLWLAPVLLVLFPLALLVSGGRFHDPKLYALIPVANFSIYLVYVWLVGRPFREVLAVAHGGAPLLEGYARELRRQRLRT
jgi:predicted anti-sigma-YlaC factor YlaD